MEILSIKKLDVLQGGTAPGLLSGDGNPSNALGNEGDTYVDNLTDAVWRKENVVTENSITQVWVNSGKTLGAAAGQNAASTLIDTVVVKKDGSTPVTSTLTVEGIPTLDAHVVRKRELDLSKIYTPSGYSVGRLIADKLDDSKRPEDFRSPTDDPNDWTAAFVRMRTLCPRCVYELRDDRVYVLDNFSPGAAGKIRGGQIKALSPFRPAIRLNSNNQIIDGVSFDQGVFDADGLVDPTKAGAGTIKSSTTNTVTVSAGEGSRFCVGMEAFFETTWAPGGVMAKGVADAYRITAIEGDTLTFNRAFLGNVVGTKIMAAMPLIEFSNGAFQCAVVNSRFRNFCVAIRTGSIDGTNAGNARVNLSNLNFEQFTGAAIIQVEGMAGERIQGIQIEGSHTVRQTSTATHGQTVFPYAYNVTPYMHRFDERTVTVRVNGVAVASSGYTVDPSTATVTLSNPASLADVVVVSNNEWSPRGLLFEGTGGSVNGMGRVDGIIILTASIGLHVRGGSGGVEYLSLTNATLDTFSFAAVVIEDTRSANITNANLWYAPYPVIIGHNVRQTTLGEFGTSLMPSSAIRTPADRPSRAEITVDPTATNIRVNRDGWASQNSYNVRDAATDRITWGSPVKLLEDGLVSSPSLAFRGDMTSGLFRTSDGRIATVVGGKSVAVASDTGLAVPYGSSGSPGFHFNGATTTGFRYDGSGSAAKLRAQVDGVDRLFIGNNDVGTLSVPFRFATFTTSALTALTGATNGQVAYTSNGGMSGGPALLAYVNGVWDYLLRGADLANLNNSIQAAASAAANAQTTANAALSRDGSGEMTGSLKNRLTSTRYAMANVMGYANTTTATPAKIGLTGNNTAPLFVLPDNAMASVEINVVVISQGGSAGYWKITGAVKRWNGSASTIGTPLSMIGVDASIAASDAQLVIDGETGNVNVQITGIATNMYWTANLSATVQMRP